MKQLICGLLLLVATSGWAQTSGEAFYQKYESVLQNRFGNVATRKELLYLLESIIDHRHLEVDYNQYFRPVRTPLAHHLHQQQPALSLAHWKSALVYPLLRFVLTKTTPVPDRAAGNSAGQKLAAGAFAYLGVPYGSPTFNRQTNRGTLDCSGLVRYVMEDIGLPYRGGNGSRAVAGLVSSPDFKTVTGDPQPGDLLVRKHKNNQWSHVGIYVGDRQLIEAPYSGTVVRTTPYQAGKWHRILRYARP
ncbi:C40 family peptidase [Tellurirhabdus rosea]|uniref:C40 family peptidase n=1 Tax=Tellurirhabdus rosea TaxID=2674997 RepID=UPI002254DB7B|nr:NlpC/P60 family protein [Tellurirhabdus rosea]